MCSIPELKPLELYIGTSEAQNAVVYPLDQLPHLLVCGMNGCGRSSFLRAQAAILAHGAPAEQLRLVLLDETGVEFVQFKELPHLLMPPVSAPEKKAGAMLALCMELQWRYSVFAKCGARELEDYNQQAETPLPHIVAIMDGLEDLLAQKECCQSAGTLYRKAGSGGRDYCRICQPPCSPRGNKERGNPDGSPRGGTAADPRNGIILSH